MKFLCICQSGLGSSFMVQMNIQNLLNSEGVVLVCNLPIIVGRTVTRMSAVQQPTWPITSSSKRRLEMPYPVCRKIALSCSTA